MLCWLGRCFGSNKNILYGFVLYKKYGKISNSLCQNKTSCNCIRLKNANTKKLTDHDINYQ